MDFVSESSFEKGSERLKKELSVTIQAVRHEIIRSARVVLCTVDAASRSLLTDAELEPAASAITTAILDEAGTASEAKLPLLLLLPRLARIVAIGDQKQLPPFTHLQLGGTGGASGQLCRIFASGKSCKIGGCM